MNKNDEFYNGTDLSSKRRLMFIDDEDYYYYTYNLIIILETMGCWSDKDKYLYDYRKISVLCALITNSTVMVVVKRAIIGEALSEQDKDLLFSVYTKAKYAEKNISRLIFAIEKNEILIVKRSEKTKSIDISLNKAKKRALQKIIWNELFINERERISEICLLIKLIRTIKYETLIEKIFKVSGVTLWDF